MQRARHFRDDFVAHPDRQDEDIRAEKDLVAHARAPATAGCIAFFVPSCTTSPPCVMTVPFTTSSPRLRSKVPSFPSMSPSRLATLREYIWLAWNGIEAGMLSRPMIVTPLETTVLPASVSSTLPPVSAERSTIT